jgi:chemotaxis protein MotA
MDFTSIFGVIAGIGLVLYGYSMDGGIVSALWLPSAVVIVVGGCLGSVFVSYGFETLKKFPKMCLEIFKAPKSTVNKTIEYLVSLSEIAKQSGLLNLEKSVMVDNPKNGVDPFIKKAVLCVVDGTDPEKISEILQTEIYVYEQDKATAIAMFDSCAAFAPAYGMIGTIVGMIQMLSQGMDDPNQLTKAIGVAFITTLYGSLLANLLFVPIASKLRSRLANYRMEKEMIIEAVCAIRNGVNPKMLREQLSSYSILDTKAKKSAKAAKAAKTPMAAKAAAVTNNK